MKNIATLNTSSKSMQMAIWVLMALLTIITIASTYYFHFSTPIKAVVWILWLVLVCGLGFFTDEGKKLIAFAEEAKLELIKVVWPTRQETTQTTSIVILMVSITGFVLWGVDSIMMWAVAKITNIG